MDCAQWCHRSGVSWARHRSLEDSINIVQEVLDPGEGLTCSPYLRNLYTNLVMVWLIIELRHSACSKLTIQAEQNLQCKQLNSYVDLRRHCFEQALFETNSGHIHSSQVPGARPSNLLHQAIKPFTSGHQTFYIRPSNLLHQAIKPFTSGHQTFYTRPSNLLHQAIKPFTPGHQTFYTRPSNLLHQAIKPFTPGHQTFCIRPSNLLHQAIKPFTSGHQTFYIRPSNLGYLGSAYLKVLTSRHEEK